MSASHPNVLHVIGDDTPPSRLDTLAALRAAPELARQQVIQIGGRHVDHSALGAVDYRAAPFGVARHARPVLEKFFPPPEDTVVHVWSPRALDWIVPATLAQRHPQPPAPRRDCPLLVDLEAPLDVRRLARGLGPYWSQAEMRFVCPNDTIRRRLTAVGIGPDDCVLIRDSVDFAAINAARKSDVRAELALSARHTLIVVLPPVLRETGAHTAAWGAMILNEVRPGVRLILPESGREAARVNRLIESSGRRQVLCRPRRRHTLWELLTAADLAVYLPPADAPLSSLAWAMAAGTPILASAVPATTELLAHGLNASLCHAQDPRDTARRMLQAIENPPQSKRQAQLAHTQAFKAFSRRRLIDQVRRVYDNLLAGRRLAYGLEELVVIR